MVARVGAELLSQTQPDDAAADALRVSAPEVLEPVCLR
jgi:glycerol-3-phosphate dehydrogenase